MTPPRRVVNNSTIQAQSRLNWSDIEDARARLGGFEVDAKKEARKKQGLCKRCFYLHPTKHEHFGESEFSEACVLCGTDYLTCCKPASAYTCIKCANTHSVCRKCGGDSEMRQKRRNGEEIEPRSNHEQSDS